MAASRRGSSGDSASVVDKALIAYGAEFREPRWQEYLAMHHPRYRILLRQVLEIVAGRSEGGAIDRVLVVGPRFEVDLLHKVAPHVRVDTLGLNAGLFPPSDGEERVLFDLNDADDAMRRPSLGPYMLIVMAEVLEHVHMPPSVVLGWLASLLSPGGYLLVQTPNAVALPKRLRMLVGINPFQPLSADRAYPGHMREYTPAELVREGRSLGLDVVDLRTRNYFDGEKASNRLYRRLERVVPKTLRAGITILYQAPRVAPPRSAAPNGSFQEAREP